jgi:hypothetical protein
MLANLGVKPSKVNCTISPQALSHPLSEVSVARVATGDHKSGLDPTALTGASQEVALPSVNASLIHRRQVRKDSSGQERR